MDMNPVNLAKKEAFERNLQERAQQVAQQRTHSPVPIRTRVKSAKTERSEQPVTKPSPRVKPRRDLSSGPSDETPNKLKRDTSTGVLDEESKKKLVTNRPRSQKLPNLAYKKPSNHKLIKNAIT